jgi:prepilin-type N-terminal cleavage/methylation domain-containing protein
LRHEKQLPDIPPCRPLSRAFTLIELLAVIALIGILTAILIPTLSARPPERAIPAKYSA